jgi:uncharacterized membrane protein
MEKISKRRSLIKALLYRIVCTTETYIAIYIVAWFIHDPNKIAAIAAGVLFFVKILSYYLYERLWSKIEWGIK